MKRIHSLLIAITVVLALQTLQGQDGGWQFTLGGGIAGENVYIGSDHYYLMPLPNLKASYDRGSFHYSLSLLEGLQVTYRAPRYGLLASLNINAGDTRKADEYSVLGMAVDHREETRKRLAGTPDLDTPLALNAMLAAPSPVGVFGVALTYHPTRVAYADSDRPDETRGGFVYSALYMMGFSPSDRLSVTGLVSIDFMDQTYADTWFSVNRPTASLSPFAAGAGLRSTTVAVEITYPFSRRVDLSLVGASTVLLGGTKDSPFTVETVQRTMTMQVLYHF